MYYTAEHHPDCRVFVKRLVTPKVGVSADIKKTEVINYERAKRTVNETHISDNVLREAFSLYRPTEFLPDLINYYKQGQQRDEGFQKDVFDMLDIVKEDTTESNNLAKEIEALKSKKILMDSDRNTLAQKEADKSYLDIEIANMQRSLTTVRATYEPLLLEIAIGVYSAQTTILRTGIGTASIVIRLPLEENGFFENILYALKDTDMWNLDEQFKEQSSQFKQVSPRQLNIFKVIGDQVDRRECSLLPHDMVQIWFSKRYSDTTAKKDTIKNVIGIPRFPRDYVSGFTGFIKSTNVSYTGGQSPSYTVTIDCEDAGHCLRISRVNLDPSLDPRYRLDSLDITVWQNKLSALDSPFRSPSEYIRSMVEGRKGYWGGVSQIEVQDDMEFDKSTGIYYYKSSKDAVEKNDARDMFTYRGVSLIHMPWELDKIKLNLYDDLITFAWKPYVTTFKNAFKLWESDYKYRWDICKEISDVMEFEFYADNFGAINYHPPFYNWNPANVKYFIEDREILSESHKFDETGVVTSVEIVSQPQILQMENIAKILSAFARAPDDIIQRYGLRFRSKNIPALSGTDLGVQEGPMADVTRKARNLYARAWINRRNAEMKSATVEIPGTPELYLCNTVAFVGDLNDVIKKLALSTVGQVAGSVTGIPGVEVGTPLVTGESGTRVQTPLVSLVVNNMPVYYISGISHKYTQGGSFTTSLTLTHGRRWGEHWSVGYSFSLQDHEELVALMKEYFKQPENPVNLFKLATVAGPVTKNNFPVIDAFALTDRVSSAIINKNLNIPGTNTGVSNLT